MDIYQERAHLLALLACHYPAHMSPATDPEPGFRKVLCLHIDGHQHAWHIADSDDHLFWHVRKEPGHYDGHTTEEKYRSIEKHVIHARRMTR
jgi:hypothetical protein